MVWRIFSIIAAIGIATVCGIWLGLQSGQSQDREAAEKAQGYYGKERVIAVVNLDDGVIYDDVQSNYASDFIESALDKQYKLMPYPMAEAGLQKGTYDAVIAFPVDFSRKVDSVNLRNPIPITMEYDVNKDLPEDLYVKTIQTIEDFQAQLNAELSYRYVSSVFEQMHQLQNQSSRLMANDKTDMQSAEGVKTFDFPSGLDLADMPETNMEMNEFDYTGNVQEVRGIIRYITDLYFDSYDDAKKVYDGVHEGLKGKTSDALTLGADWESKLANWRDKAKVWVEESNPKIEVYNKTVTTMGGIVGHYNGKVDEFYDLVTTLSGINGTNVYAALSNYQDMNLNWRSELSRWLADVVLVPVQSDLPALANDMEDAVNDMEKTANDIAITATDMTTIASNMAAKADAADKAMMEDSAKKMDENATKIKGQVADIKMQTGEMKNKLAAIKTSLIAMGAPPTPPASQDATSDAAFTQWSRYYTSLSAITANRASDHFDINDFPTITDTIPTAPAIPGFSSGDLDELMTTIQAISGSYNPLSYFTKEDRDKEQAQIDKYEGAISKVQEGVGKSMTANFDAISKTYVTYNEHISSVRDTVYAAYEKEKNDVAGTIKDFIQTKMHTSEENKKLIANFATMMPNSWSGSDVNARVAEFITTPVNMNHVEIRKLTPTLAENYSLWIMLGLGVLVLMLVASVTFGLTMRARRRRIDE